METSYILFQLRPHHANFRKRLVKSPKIYFYDTGLLCWLLGVQEAGQLAAHPLRGSIFETFVVSELVKDRLNRLENVELYFWRDSHGNEIDIIADFGDKLMPIEIKAGQTLNRDFFTGLDRWLSMAGKRATSPALVSPNPPPTFLMPTGHDALARSPFEMAEKKAPRLHSARKYLKSQACLLFREKV